MGISAEERIASQSKQIAELRDALENAAKELDLMRDLSCWDSPYHAFYVDLAAYCNQPGIFKKLDFFTFLERRHTDTSRIKLHGKMYLESLKK